MCFNSPPTQHQFLSKLFPLYTVQEDSLHYLSYFSLSANKRIEGGDTISSIRDGLFAILA